MRVMLLALTLSVVALAGCSDEPPSGTFASSGNAIVVDGNYTVEFQAFNNPYAQTADTQLACQQSQIPSPVGDNVDQCTFPFTKAMGHVMELPVADSQGYAVYFVDESFTNQPFELDVLSANTMADWSFDNSDDCDGQQSDDGCNFEGMYSHIEVRLVSQDLAIASAAISSSGDLAIADAILGVSFDASYSGKELTLTTSGIGNYTVEGWTVSIDPETQEKVHEDSFSVANGETVFEAPKNISEYDEIHLHVAGTSINLAVATVS
ncbi:MAG: hypothetical protein ACPHID_06375 [Thermoplasmatota archaeon]